MKYKVNVSEQLRIEQQYLGFLDTEMPRIIDNQFIKSFKPDFSNREVPIFSVPPKLILGKRAELFFNQAIEQSEEFEAIASGIQLISKGITQGELDFLIYSLQEKLIIHVELAYKFYLFDANASNELGHWVGPNRRDSLKKKITKLQDQQFPKLYFDSAKEHLDKLSINLASVSQKLYLPMQLFIPFASKMDISNMNVAPKGEWISSLQFFEMNWNEYLFFIPEKQDWFVDPKHCEVWFTLPEIVSQIKESLAISRSPMVWTKLPSGKVKKLFITFW